MKRLDLFYWSLLITGLALAALALALIVHSFYIGFLAPSSVVNQYYFGSEAMVGNGGWGYTSREAYFWSSLYKTAWLWLPGIILFVAGLKPVVSRTRAASSPRF